MKKLLLIVILLNTQLCHSQLIVKLAWDPSISQNITKYLFYRATNNLDFTVVTNALPTPPYIIEVPVIPNIVNSYFATAVTLIGESQPSNIVIYLSTNSVPTNPPPVTISTPTNLRIVLVNGRRFDLQWKSDPAFQVEIQQSIKAEPFNTIATVSAGNMHYTIQLDKRREYTFRVRSVKYPQTSDYSNIATTR